MRKSIEMELTLKQLKKEQLRLQRCGENLIKFHKVPFNTVAIKELKYLEKKKKEIDNQIKNYYKGV